MKNCVYIQLKKEKILIKVAEDAEQAEIIECLRGKVVELKKLYQNEETPIYVVGKVLKNKEMEEIQEVIKNAIDIKVEFETPRILGLHGIKKSFSKEIASSDTKFHKGSLRSGQKVEYEGSIVILGDVNGGAEVIAGENIVVLGVLRGLAHAGAKGNKQAIIAANVIDCPQIRISNIIKELDKTETEEVHNYAYIDEENTIIVS